MKLSNSHLLKISLFATGFSGIVAEYILSTLATYFLGNSVLQWTMILSTMLFSMGVGSRISKYFVKNLIQKFIFIEFLLSILISFSVLFTYLTSGYTSFNYDISVYFLRYDAVVIYFSSIAIGLLIGMEVPLVTRINESFEELRVNVSSILENDYYGSLLGGVFFAFIGLPIIGLKYTPFILGLSNFSVAVWLFFQLRKKIKKYYYPIQLTMLISLFTILLGLFYANTIFEYGEQKKYVDRIVLQKQTLYQKVVITQWKNDYWFYINGNQQLSTRDEWMYHEPMVLPVMSLHPYPENILVLGGGDGCAAREILKFPSVSKITLVDMDEEVTHLAQTHAIFTSMNKGSLNDPKLNIVNEDAFSFLLDRDQKDFFDVMILDFPDPKTVELSRLFSLELYRNCFYSLRPDGLIVVQAGSPYYATTGFYCIKKTLEKAGFYTLPLHNQVPTLGEWGWIIGSKKKQKKELIHTLQNYNFDSMNTRWLNNESISLITSFGKPIINIPEIEVNSIDNPVLYNYYLKGNWDIY